MLMSPRWRKSVRKDRDRLSAALHNLERKGLQDWDDSEFLQSRDPAVRVIASRVTQCLEEYERRLTYAYLRKEEQDHIDRCLLFLESNLPYGRFPTPVDLCVRLPRPIRCALPFIASPLLIVLVPVLLVSFAFADVLAQQYKHVAGKFGLPSKENVWPFRNVKQLSEAHRESRDSRLPLGSNSLVDRKPDRDTQREDEHRKVFPVEKPETFQSWRELGVLLAGHFVSAFVWVVVLYVFGFISRRLFLAVLWGGYGSLLLLGLGIALWFLFRALAARKQISEATDVDDDG